jgi:hypothetical protein
MKKQICVIKNIYCTNYYNHHRIKSLFESILIQKVKYLIFHLDVSLLDYIYREINQPI